MTRWSRSKSEIRALTDENNALRAELRNLEELLAREQSANETLLETNAINIEANQQLIGVAESIQADRAALADWLVDTRAPRVKAESTRKMLYRIAQEIRTGQFTDGSE
jgi:chromosome segregation ATPase